MSDHRAGHRFIDSMRLCETEEAAIRRFLRTQPAGLILNHKQRTKRRLRLIEATLPTFKARYEVTMTLEAQELGHEGSGYLESRLKQLIHEFLGRSSV